MSRLLHLSDLHFGRSEPALEAPLLAAISRIRPDLVVVSGDFTQRARVAQFRQARAFLERVEAPLLCVPGNHDTPLDNVLLRFLRPFGRYRRWIDRDLEPTYRDAALSVVGVNTVNPFAWQQGRFRRRALERVCTAFEDAGDRLRVAVLHHPLEHGPEVEKRPMRGAARALRGLSDCGADVVLSGHLHRAGTAPFRAAPGLLFVQAGTGLSTRRRGETNTFNMLDLSGERLRVTEWAAEWDRAGGVAFAPGRSNSFCRDRGAWIRSGPGAGLFDAGAGGAAPVSRGASPGVFPAR
ncbi:metallophosphoesterase family protein [Pseudooceanicola sp. CBS1P-1]|uniref:Metallophosphoesterase n=1 Tax=Pseudooceanicola albus TaxID=2692189 RepID=A0A6L7G8H8_9RHOB|nr:MULTISPECIES: metallophosphoesterase family protein [Pseudooceanicola]MBT9384195.1 metallophosphoesterase family protein [Pseudooceanicola endophyticus]MXN19706.1 metallophosphoesterase [Pseudooceanicola albus]